MNTQAGAATSNYCLEAQDLAVAYGERSVLTNVSLRIPTGELTVIVGPNGGGKSTLLHVLARMLTPATGRVLLHGEPITSYGSKEVARRLGLLPQSPVAPEGMLVEDLVARGRYPHQGIFHQWSSEDTQAVSDAIERAGVVDLMGRTLETLSGGQRQRVWLAMALAQQTSVLLLDEPTAHLDISHQVDLLNLCAEMQRDGMSVVAVLHDLNLAFRYAGWLIVIGRGGVLAAGRPEDIVDEELMASAFNLACRIIPDPETGTPMVVPVRPTGRADQARMGSGGGGGRALD